MDCGGCSRRTPRGQRRSRKGDGLVHHRRRHGQHSGQGLKPCGGWRCRDPQGCGLAGVVRGSTGRPPNPRRVSGARQRRSSPDQSAMARRPSAESRERARGPRPVHDREAILGPCSRNALLRKTEARRSGLCEPRSCDLGSGASQPGSERDGHRSAAALITCRASRWSCPRTRVFGSSQLRRQLQRRP